MKRVYIHWNGYIIDRENESKMSSEKSDSGRFGHVKKKIWRQVDLEFYDTKESGTFTAFIEQ